VNHAREDELAGSEAWLASTVTEAIILLWKPVWFSSKRPRLAGGLASSPARRGLARENALMDSGLANLNWFTGDDSCGSASLMQPFYYYYYNIIIIQVH
jgi:hypothetical protein